MPNTRSAEKNVRKTKTRTLRNKQRKAGMRAARRALQNAIEAGDAAVVQEKFRAFASVADKAAKVGLIHKNKASRLKSRMSLRMKKGPTPKAKGRNAVA